MLPRSTTWMQQCRHGAVPVTAEEEDATSIVEEVEEEAIRGGFGNRNRVRRQSRD